jgi:hypothetical protein
MNRKEMYYESFNLETLDHLMYMIPDLKFVEYKKILRIVANQDVSFFQMVTIRNLLAVLKGKVIDRYMVKNVLWLLDSRFYSGKEDIKFFIWTHNTEDHLVIPKYNHSNIWLDDVNRIIFMDNHVLYKAFPNDTATSLHHMYLKCISCYSSVPSDIIVIE